MLLLIAPVVQPYTPSTHSADMLVLHTGTADAAFLPAPMMLTEMPTVVNPTPLVTHLKSDQRQAGANVADTTAHFCSPLSSPAL